MGNLVRLYLHSLVVPPFLEPKSVRGIAWRLFGFELLGFILGAYTGFGYVYVFLGASSLSGVAWQVFVIGLVSGFIYSFAMCIRLWAARRSGGNIVINVLLATLAVIIIVVPLDISVTVDKLHFTPQNVYTVFTAVIGVVGVKLLPLLGGFLWNVLGKPIIDWARWGGNKNKS